MILPQVNITEIEFDKIVEVVATYSKAISEEVELSIY